jgi:hypothetical protein
MATLVSVELIEQFGDEDFRGNVFTSTEIYKVIFDDDTAIPRDALYATGIPAAFAQLSTYQLFVANRDAKQKTEDPRVWHVTVVYKSPGSGNSEPRPEEATDHTKWNVEVSGEAVPFEEMQHRDAAGKPVLLTTGEAVAVPKRYYDERITVSFHVKVPQWAVVDACRGKVNDAEITFTVNGASRTFAAGSLLLDSDSFSLIYDSNGDKAINYRYLLCYRKDLWTYKVENKSLYRLDTGTSKLVRWTDNTIDKSPYVSSPVPMKADGTRCASGEDVHLISATVYAAVSFTALLAEID